MIAEQQTTEIWKKGGERQEIKLQKKERNIDMQKREIDKKKDMDTETLAGVLKALADPTRLKMLAYLRERSLCVCELQAFFSISQPAISQHLRKLKSVGLVTERRQGQWVYYSLKEDLYPFLPEILYHIPSVHPEVQTLIREMPVTCESLANTEDHQKNIGNSLCFQTQEQKVSTSRDGLQITSGDK